MYHETGDEHHFATRRCARRCRRAPTPMRQWFAHEMDRVFARMWLAAGRADRARPRRRVHPPRRRRRERADRARRRRRDSRVPQRLPPSRHAALHRGARHAFSGSIQCPYHAWTYGLDGRLLAAPQMDEVDGFDRSEYPLRGVACDTWDGHIFINLVPDSRAARATQLGELPARFAPWRDAGSAAGAPHRVRRRHQLEAGGAELQRVPALPGDPSAAQPDASLSRRRERADDRAAIAAARWGSRTASRR